MQFYRSNATSAIVANEPILHCVIKTHVFTLSHDL